MSGPSVLFDAPGPRGRRRILIVTALSLVAVAAVLVMAARRLAARGELGWDRWAPLLDPRDELFGDLWRFLLGGLQNTVIAAAVTIVISLALGTLLGAALAGRRRWFHPLLRVAVELLRGIPVVIAIFFAARVLPEVGRTWFGQSVDLPLLWYVVIGLVIYNTVVIAEIVRAGVAAIPRGQQEAAAALGLSHRQVMRLVLLPQAFRVMLPALISQLVVALKDTSLGFVIGFPELLRRANVSIQTTERPIQTLTVVAAVYIAINYSLGRLAGWVHDRTASRTAAD